MNLNLAAIGGDIGAFTQAAIAWATVAVPRLVGAILIVTIGWWIAGRAQRGVVALMRSQSMHVDVTLGAVVASLVRYGILIIVIVAFLGQLGIQTTSVLAALGAAGLAIGLAIQGTLTNIASGMMLLWLRPFRVGDYIDTGAVAGTVKEVGLFATEMHSWDGIYLFVPNSELWSKRITNYSRLPTRLVDLKFGVGYSDDLKKGQAELLAMASRDPRVLPEPSPPQVFVDELGDSAVVLRLRFWASNADYWPLYRGMMEEGKARLEAAGLSIPFPQRDLHVIRPPRPAGAAA